MPNPVPKYQPNLAGADLQEDEVAVVEVVPPKPRPPGKKSAGKNVHLDLFLELIARMESGLYGPPNDKKNVHLHPKGSSSKLAWTQFANESYDGWVAVNGEVVPGFMSGYQKWDPDRIHDKMKGMTKSFLEHHADIAVEKHLKNITPEPHEQKALDILKAMNRAQAVADNARAAKSAKIKATRLENESEEMSMGIRPKKKHSSTQARGALYEKTTSPGPGESTVFCIITRRFC